MKNTSPIWFRFWKLNRCSSLHNEKDQFHHNERTDQKEWKCKVIEKREESVSPISTLTLLKGTIIEQDVEILKDDGCHTNVISLDFINKQRDNLDVMKFIIAIFHSDKFTEENVSEVVYDTKIKLGKK